MTDADDLIETLDEREVTYAIKDNGRCVTVWLSTKMNRQKRSEIEEMLEAKAEQYKEHGIENGWRRFHAQFTDTPVSREYRDDSDY